MKIEIRASANKDVKSLPTPIKEAIHAIVLKMIAADNLNGIANIKKLKGHETAYRIKIKDYRIGFFLDNETIIISRILHRKEVYRYFP